MDLNSTSTNLYLNQRVGLLRCVNNYNISYPYIYLLTNSSDFLTDLRNRANSGVQVNLSSTEIKASEVIIPDRETNYKFDQVGKAIFEKIFHNQQENTRLAQLRDTLLPKLMSGEIDVSKVDISDLTSSDKLSFSKYFILIIQYTFHLRKPKYIFQKYYLLNPKNLYPETLCPHISLAILDIDPYSLLLYKNLSPPKASTIYCLPL